jgi:hypothetical protein
VISLPLSLSLPLHWYNHWYYHWYKHSLVLTPLTGQCYSHIGIVIDPNLVHVPFLNKDKLYVWEAIGSGHLCGQGDGVRSVLGGNNSFVGVQFRNLAELAELFTTGQVRSGQVRSGQVRYVLLLLCVYS